ncbi:MAG: DUF6273 domain-containing protein [Lachnospiraceae bacterium]|nr:DUF6273 domain-containing protein [Lachnospiraceae bacterium]
MFRATQIKREYFKAAFERANWWLRDVVSSTNFANVNSNGNSNYNNASNTWIGVRPDFDKPSNVMG